MKKKTSRRKFLQQSTLVSAGLVGYGMSTAGQTGSRRFSTKPALLGGQPIRSKAWPQWPMWTPDDEALVVKVLRSGKWSRGEVVKEFEFQWAKQIGTKRALATVNGTSALITALTQMDVGGGDEVILPAYTFIATLTAVLATGAMPVFADVDPDTFQIDPRSIKEKITDRTRVIVPVHIAGLPADMKNILSLASDRKLLVLEDACQAWLAEIDNQKVGSFGQAGCFSFQNSKNIPIGEGGAVVSNDDQLMDRCFSYHNFGLPYQTAGGRPGAKLRLTEYQAAIGLAQLQRLDEQTTLRNKNAAYLQKLLLDIKGIKPYRLYDNVTRAAFHLFPFRYDKNAFAGLPRATFIKALSAEGIPCSSGYAPLNKVNMLGNTFQTKNYRKMYSAAELNEQQWEERNQCAVSERLCLEEAVWFQQNLLLTGKEDMQEIAAAILKIQQHAGDLKRQVD